MSLVKHHLAVSENLRRIAATLLVETGALEECPHETLLWTYNNEAVTLAYGLANARITSGEIELPAGYSRRDLTDAIKSLVDETGESCAICDRNRED
jgi:hypothetical protein